MSVRFFFNNIKSNRFKINNLLNLSYDKTTLNLKNMKKILEKSIFILSLGIAISCGNNNGNETRINNDTIIKTVSEQEAAAVKGKYAIKSGILQMKATTLGISQDITIYFDDFGDREMTDINVSMLGVKTHQMVISDSGNLYTIDLDKKTGYKIKADTQNIEKPEDFNFLKLTEKNVKDFQIKKEGQAQFLDRLCDIYKVNNSKFNGTFYVWKGIALKTEANAMNMKTTIEVKKIEENVKIPADKFKIPDGVKISDIDLKGENIIVNK